MRLVGMMLARSEDWVIDLSARAALKWCDVLVILNHASNDLTGYIILKLIQEYGDRVRLVYRPDTKWTEMEHRQELLEAARDCGATHLAIIDADEILTGNLLDSVRIHVESLPPGRMLQLPGYNLRGGLDTFHSSGIWSDRWFSVAFQDDRRLGWSGDRFHQRDPGGALLQQARPIAQGAGGILHLWGASERRLRAKHAAYKMIETLRWPEKPRQEINQLYNLAFVPAANLNFAQDWRYDTVSPSWWAPYWQLRRGVQLGATPWQEGMCRQLIREHGPERFDGLELFGVTERSAVTQ